MKICFSSVVFLLCIPVVVTANELPQSVGRDLGSIWFIGDSITQSNADGDAQGSPRKSLYDLLKADGYSFTYTGHHAKNIDGLPATDSTPAANLYHYHTGVSGFLIGEEQATPGAKRLPGIVPNLKKYWQKGRLATVKPSIILIMLGTNDVGHGFELDNAPNRLRGLLNSIYNLPDVGQPKIFLATIPPNRRKEADRTNVIVFNEAVPRIVADYQAKGKAIYLVDQFKPIDDAYEANMRGDNLHPNAAGNDTMAKQWRNAIQKAANGQMSVVRPKDPTPVIESIEKHTAEPLAWTIDTQVQWEQNTSSHNQLELKDGMASPTVKQVTFQSTLKTFRKQHSAESITLAQSPVWHNWEPIKRVGPANLGDAPVMLTLGPGNYWMFGRYRSKQGNDFKSKDAELAGFDVPLKTTPFANQYDAPGGLKKGLGGYHAWQSKDLKSWVHHGPVTEAFSCWVTTAEYVDGKVYIYYDFPNDQDPHLYIDEDLTDGVPGKNMGMAFKDPSHGSDCSFIRDLQGNFHVIYEDWSPIDASKHSWDSPLAGHAISADGIANFKILPPAVDERTKPTGKFAEYPHPHWHASAPQKYPGKVATVDVPQHRVKAGDTRAFGKYEVHTPVQNAYGDWAAISIGGQYYLFSDYHPANSSIRVGWFTSSSLDKPFAFCGEIGKGHPDPDIAFAEGKFYLTTQLKTDFVSPGPWVETVEVRVGVDTNKDAEIDQWTDWKVVKESYDYIPGFAKQVTKTAAALDLSELPKGHGFQFEVRMTDTTENDSKPILDQIKMTFTD